MSDIRTNFALQRLGRNRQRGFNFAEVLFAVMILGIGFIMIAAIFPVALQQTRTTGEEVVASTVARGGVNYFQQVGLTARALPATDLFLIPDPALAKWPNRVATAVDPATPTVEPGESMRVPGRMISFRDNRVEPVTRDAIWRQISGNLILPDDNRVAWIGMFRRGITYTNPTDTALPVGDPDVLASPDASAHVVVIGVQVRNRSIYEAAKDLRRYPADAITGATPATVSATPATLEPVTVYVKLTERQTNIGPPADTVDTVTFYDGPTAGATPLANAVTNAGPFAEGAYIVISDDQIPDAAATPSVYERGQRNGRVFRLGTRREDLGAGVWELAPDGDLRLIDPDGTPGNADDISENIPVRAVHPPNTNPAGPPAVAFMVGRGRTDPAIPAGDREGAAQDTGVFVTIVPAN